MLKKLVFISIFSFLLLLKVTSVSAEDGGIETQTPPNLPYCTTRLLLVQELFPRNGTLITGYGTTLDSCTKAVRAQTTVCLESPNQQPSINQMCLDAIAKTTDPAKPAPLNQATIIDPKRPCRDDDFTSYINRADFNNAHYDTVENCQNTVYNEIQTFNTLNAHCDLTPDQKSKIGKYCEAGVKSGNFDEKTLATPAPNAVPTDVPGCGLKDNVCCKGDPTQIKAGELKSSKENCFFICLADLFNFIGGIFTNSLGDENKTKLDQFGFCYNVEPTTGAQLNLLPTFNSADSNAICTCKEVSGDVEAYHLCDQYIATAYNTIKNPKDKERTADEYRSCVACSIGVPVSSIPSSAVNTAGGETNTAIPSPNPTTVALTGGIWTGMGCIFSASPKQFIEKNVMPTALGFGGLAALLCIIFSAISFQTSAGNPEKVKNAQQMMTSCISGLILIIFAIFIIRLIGVDILGLPGLSSQ